jgi:hypothetical protein
MAVSIHLTTLPIAQEYSCIVGWLWVMTGKAMEAVVACFAAISSLFFDGETDARSQPVFLRITGTAVDIRTQHVSNTAQDNELVLKCK